MSTTESEQSGQSVDPRLRRLTEGYRRIMEGAPVAFPPRIAELYAPRRRETTRAPDGADLLLDRPPEG